MDRSETEPKVFIGRMPDVTAAYATVNLALGCCIALALAVPYLANATLLELFPSCPRAAVGLPCSSCGITRALVMLYRGDLHSSIALHPAAVRLVVVAAMEILLRLPVRALGARLSVPWLDLTQLCVVVCWFGLVELRASHD